MRGVVGCIALVTLAGCSGYATEPKGDDGRVSSEVGDQLRPDDDGGVPRPLVDEIARQWTERGDIGRGVYVPADSDGQGQARVAASARVVLSAPRTSVPAGEAGGVDALWWPLVTRYFGAYADEAMRVIFGTANCPNGESGGDPNAENGPNKGGFQINIAVHGWRLRPGERIFDPEVNTRIASEIWRDNNGWSAWSCRP